MKTLIIFIVLLFSLMANAQDRHLTKQQKKVVNLIAALPEVNESNKYMLKYNKHPLVIDVDSDPAIDKNCYCISVYQNLGDHLAALYHFNVNAKTYAISYWDVAADKVMSLKAWRRQQRNHNYLR